VNARLVFIPDKTALAVFCFKIISRDAARRWAGCLIKFAWADFNRKEHKEHKENVY
jgi:hypothetical protein